MMRLANAAVSVVARQSSVTIAVPLSCRTTRLTMRFLSLLPGGQTLPGKLQKG